MQVSAVDPPWTDISIRRTLKSWSLPKLLSLFDSIRRTSLLKEHLVPVSKVPLRERWL